jgi:hypothetical protein
MPPPHSATPTTMDPADPAAVTSVFRQCVHTRERQVALNCDEVMGALDAAYAAYVDVACVGGTRYRFIDRALRVSALSTWMAQPLDVVRAKTTAFRTALQTLASALQTPEYLAAQMLSPGHKNAWKGGIGRLSYVIGRLMLVERCEMDLDGHWAVLRKSWHAVERAADNAYITRAAVIGYGRKHDLEHLKALAAPTTFAIGAVVQQMAMESAERMPGGLTHLFGRASGGGGGGGDSAGALAGLLASLGAARAAARATEE